MTTRLLGAITLIGLTVAALAAFLAPTDAGAGVAAATCTKAPDLRYDCTKALAVGDHMQINANGGVCHANVTAIGTISPTLKSASITINHGVTNCYWAPNTNVAIGWRVIATPTPTGNFIAVGGVAGLLENDGGPASGSGSDGSGANMAIALATAIAAATVAIALAARVTSKAGTTGD